jgi:hypothetical protein
MESSQDLGQEVRRDNRGCRDPKPSALETSDFTQFLLGESLDTKELSSACVENAACGGQPGRTTRPIDQANVERSLQLVERFRDSWLAKPEVLGCSGEAAVVDDGRKQAEVVEIHLPLPVLID